MVQPHCKVSPKKLSQNRKMNFEFWDDMIFLIGPRLNEFNVQQINQLLSGASRPKIGKKSVQR